MAAVSRITYVDGTTADVRWRPALTLQVERKWPDPTTRPVFEADWFALWCGVGKPGTFDEWLETVDGSELVDDGADAVPPSDPPDGTSPN